MEVKFAKVENSNGEPAAKDRIDTYITPKYLFM